MKANFVVIPLALQSCLMTPVAEKRSASFSTDRD